MARVKPVRKAADYPGNPDAATRADLAHLFGSLFPGNPAGEIDHGHSGLAVAAQNPKLALHLAAMSRFIALELPWCQRHDLRELAIQALNRHYGSSFSNAARLSQAHAAGLSDAQLAAVADWRGSPLFGEEQRLVLEYTEAVIAGTVKDALFARLVSRFGEKEAVECTAAIGWWSFWAMLIEATAAGE